MTVPAGTVVLDDVVTVPTTRPAPLIVEVAAACVALTTFGTVTRTEPDDTTSETALPFATCTPAIGFWWSACVTEPVAINATDAMLALSGVETVNGAPYPIDAGTDVIDGRGPLKRYGGEKISAVA